MRRLMLVPLLVALAAPALAENVHVAKSQLPMAGKGMYGFSADGKLVYTSTEKPDVITQGGVRVVLPTLVIDAQTGKTVRKLSNVVNFKDKIGLAVEFMMEAGVNAMQYPTKDNKLTVGLFPRTEPDGLQPAVVDPEKGGVKLLGPVISSDTRHKGAALSHNNRWFAAIVEPEAADRAFVFVYDVQAGKQAAKIEIPYGEEAFTLFATFAGDRLHLLVDDRDAKVTTIRSYQGPGFKPAGEWTPTEPDQDGLQYPFSVDPSGTKLLTYYYGADSRLGLALLHPTNFSVIRRIPLTDAHYAFNNADNWAWSPDGRYFAGHDDESGRVIILDTEAGEFVADIPTPARSLDMEWGDATLRWFGMDKLVVVGADGPLQQHPPLIVTITNPVP